jgi:hypothetical protein
MCFVYRPQQIEFWRHSLIDSGFLVDSKPYGVKKLILLEIYVGPVVRDLQPKARMARPTADVFESDINIKQYATLLD